MRHKKAETDWLVNLHLQSNYIFRGALVLTPIFFPPSPPSPNRLKARGANRSFRVGKEDDELRLRDAGEDGMDEWGVVDDDAILLTAAAAAGLQCAQMKMLKPRPSQLLQIDRLLIR